MENTEILEIMSKTSAFKENLAKSLLEELKNNLNLPLVEVNNQLIRSSVLNNNHFADAQATCHFMPIA